MSGYIKFNRTPEAEHLLQYPNTFALLAVIAFRARRKSCRFTGLNPNQAYVGDCKAYGMTERSYRTAKGQLERWGLATFKGTNRGTIATLMDSVIFDLNIAVIDDDDEFDGEKNSRRTHVENTSNSRGKATSKRRAKNNCHSTTYDDLNSATDEQPTSERRTKDEQPTTNKECKNVRIIKEKEKEKPQAARVFFKKPTYEEINIYCDERGNNVDAEAFFDFYESKGWKVGNSSMKDWKAAVRNWEKRMKKERSGAGSGQTAVFGRDGYKEVFVK